MLTRGLVVLLLAIALASSAAWAAGAGDRIPPNALVLTRDEIEAGQYGQDLFEVLSLLSTRAGITFKSSSDVGAEDWLLIRGLTRDSSRNVLVLLDGRPINAASAEAVDFTDAPVGMIEKIIVYRPPMPPRFGGYHSAVEILTRRPETRAAEASASLGSRDTRRFEVSAQGSGPIGYIASLERLETDNLTGVRRTPPKQTLVYGDRSYRVTVPALKLMRELGTDVEGSLYIQNLDDRKRFSSDLFRGEPEQRERQFWGFALNLAPRPGAARDFSFTAFRNDERDRLNLMMHPDFRSQDRFRQGLRGHWSRALGSGQHRFTLGADITDIHARELLGTELANLQDESFFGIFAQADFALPDRTQATLGLRLDDHSEAKREISPYLSVVRSAKRGSNLYAIWSRTARWPALSEFDMAVRPSPLRAERLEGFELGWRSQSRDGRVSSRVAAFRLDLERESGFVFIPPSTAFYANLPGSTRSEGVEAEADLRVNRRLTGFADLTWNDVTVRPGGEPVSFGGPKVLANIGARYRGQGTTLYTVARFRGDAKGVQATMGQPTVLDSHLLVDIAATRAIRGGADVFLRVSNLFDEEYETFDGRPMFGRIVILGARVRLR